MRLLDKIRLVTGQKGFIEGNSHISADPIGQNDLLASNLQRLTPVAFFATAAIS
jgi:hypothetical protein